MWIAVVVFAVLAVAVLAVVFMVPAVRRSRGEPRHDVDVVDPDVAAHDLPQVGEPSPHRPDGSPVPGSRDDRERHGKP